MTVWLKFLLIELADISNKEYVDPPTELSKDDRVLGDCSDDSKKLYTAWQWAARKLDEMGIKAKYEGALSEEGFRREADHINARVGILRELFWYQVAEDLDAHNKPIGVRRGFKVVLAKPKPPQIIQFGIGGPMEEE